MGLFTSKEEKAKKAKHKKEQEAIEIEKQKIAREKEIEKQKIAREKALEKQRVEKLLDEKIKEFGMTKLMSDPKVYNEIIIEQNKTIINMLAQVAIVSSQSFTSNTFVINEQNNYNKNVRDVLKKSI